MSAIMRAMMAALKNPDVTPDAVSWANITDGNNPNADQTFTGIDVPITLRLDVTTVNGGASRRYVLNGGAEQVFVDGTTLVVSSGDTLHFIMLFISGTPSGTVNVRNTSDGDALLDSFTYSITV